MARAKKVKEIDDTIITQLRLVGSNVRVRYDGGDECLSSITFRVPRVNKTEVEHTLLMEAINMLDKEIRYNIKLRFQNLPTAIIVDDLIKEFVTNTYDFLLERVMSVPIPSVIRKAGRNRSVIGDAINRDAARTILPEEYYDLEVGIIQLIFIPLIANISANEDSTTVPELVLSWTDRTPAFSLYVKGEPVDITEYFEHMKKTQEDDSDSEWNKFYKKMAGLRRIRFYFNTFDTGKDSVIAKQTGNSASPALLIAELLSSLANKLLVKNTERAKMFNPDGEPFIAIFHTTSKAGRVSTDVTRSLNDEVPTTAPSPTMGYALSLINAVSTPNIISTEDFIDKFLPYYEAFINTNDKELVKFPAYINQGWTISQFSFYKLAISKASEYKMLDMIKITSSVRLVDIVELVDILEFVILEENTI